RRLSPNPLRAWRNRSERMAGRRLGAVLSGRCGAGQGHNGGAGTRPQTLGAHGPSLRRGISRRSPPPRTPAIRPARPISARHEGPFLDNVCSKEVIDAMELTTSQIQQFREHGYVAVPEFFSTREVAAMRAELERLKREGFLRNVATDGDGKTHSQTFA